MVSRDLMYRQNTRCKLEQCGWISLIEDANLNALIDGSNISVGIDNPHNILIHIWRELVLHM
jgi:hypothetical protein